MHVVKLYRSSLHPGQWIAHIAGMGWWAFPAKPEGWADRKPARGVDPVHLRQAPLQMALNTGMPEAIDAAHETTAA
jgi:hypothetical protein